MDETYTVAGQSSWRCARNSEGSGDYTLCVEDLCGAFCTCEGTSYLDKYNVLLPLFAGHIDAKNGSKVNWCVRIFLESTSESTRPQQGIVFW